MLKTTLVIGVLASMSVPVFAQDVAAVDANVGGVVSQCEIVAADPELADRDSGICITATRSFLAVVVPVREDPIQELVVSLLELSQLYPECDTFDDEIGAAIREAAAGLPESSELRPDFLAAAETIEACEVTNTGAILPADASAITLG